MEYSFSLICEEGVYDSRLDSVYGRTKNCTDLVLDLPKSLIKKIKQGDVLESYRFASHENDLPTHYIVKARVINKHGITFIIDYL